MAKSTLDNAKNKKSDEFYTSYESISKEIEHYYNYNSNIFKNKTILLPCDNPEKSNFTKYFIDNYIRFGIKKVISTYFNFDGKGKVLIYTGKDVTIKKLKTNGDFRGDDITYIKNKSDIIITNPPFSLIREFFNWVIDKKFIFVSPVTSIGYKIIFPYIKNNKVWPGVNWNRNISEFIVPDTYDLYGTETKIDKNGNKIININNCIWLTNIKHDYIPDFIKLNTMEYNIKNSKHNKIKQLGYQKYDNLDAIDVPYSDSIPSDYNGIMGVPMSFLGKFNPSQFEIIGFRKGADGKDLSINGKYTFSRILIKRKNY